MRKNFAMAMLAVLALTVALAAVGCGGKKAETTTSQQPMSSPGSSMDSTMHMDSTAGK
jgi:hypothetical protein